MAGRIEKVDAITIVIELQHGGADRNSALALELHPVAGRGALVLALGHRPSQLQRAAIQQQLLGQGCLAGIRVRDNREGSAALYFICRYHYSRAILPKHLKNVQNRGVKPVIDSHSCQLEKSLDVSRYH